MNALQIAAVLAVLAVAPLHSQGSKPVYLDPAQPLECRRIATSSTREARWCCWHGEGARRFAGGHGIRRAFLFRKSCPTA
jgi:hypothetical protein